MDVEVEYLRRIRAMSSVERIRRVEALFRWSRDYLARSIVAASGSISEAALKREVALRQYGADPAVRKLIEELSSRDSS
jgi:hypothetical protein